MPDVTALADRLRDLRLSGRPGGALTQSALGRALGVSVPLISSWEHGTEPPVERLDAYARVFALADPPGGNLRVPDLGDLSASEQESYRSLLKELIRLRDHGPDAVSPHPLQFPAGQAITIVCSELPERLRSRLGYAGEEDPDFISSYKYADLDALIELLPFVQGLNPTSVITVGVVDDLSADDFTAHMIALGGVDFNAITAAALTDLKHVPVSQLSRPADEDTGGFSVHTGDGARVDHKPVLRNKDGSSTLKEDVAHFLRAPNPYNYERTLTFFNGMYSRGSYGVVRALTDPKIRERNAAYITERFGYADTYSIVCRVKIVANKVVVPDWTLSDIRLHEWPEADH